MTGTPSAIPAPAAPARPRRARRLLAAVGIVLSIGLLAACNPEADYMVEKINTERTSRGIAALDTHLDLTIKAQGWAEHMASQCKISHSDLLAGLPSGWRWAAENVGSGGTLDRVHTTLMASSGHKANILATRATHVGVGTAWNTCNGDQTVFVAEVFIQL